MASDERDREDLMREATALVERIEIEVNLKPIVVGFRRNGAGSIFFGADPVYQFNADDQLRRAFVDGLLYKAEKGRLVALRRERDAQQVSLLRHELTDSETDAFCASFDARKQSLQFDLENGGGEIVAQVPTDKDLATRVVEWLANLSYPIRFADSPRVQ